MKFTSYLAAILLLFSFGCGRDKNDCVSASAGSTITVNPGDQPIASSDPTWNNRIYTISVADADGNPNNKIKIAISYELTTVSAGLPNPVVQLYDGTVPVSSPFAACTDAFGQYTLMVGLWSGTGVTYKGNINVYSGTTIPATATFTVGN